MRYRAGRFPKRSLPFFGHAQSRERDGTREKTNPQSSDKFVSPNNKYAYY